MSEPERDTSRSRIPSEAVAAGLILAAVALGFAIAPRIVGWAGGIETGLGFAVAALLAVILGGGFIGVFWLRGRAQRRNAQRDAR